MRRGLHALGLAPILALCASAATITYTGDLSGNKEFPSNASPGTGSAAVIYDSAAHTLQVMVSFSGLVGTTSASHIHCCVATPFDFGANAGVATMLPSFAGFPSGVQSGSYDHTFDLTQSSSYNTSPTGFFNTLGGGTAAGAEAALVAGLNEGRAYLNIHSSAYPGGEIRDFLTVVPEPSTTLMIGSAAIAGLIFRLRRRKR